MVKKTPCYNCTDRKLYCHSQCNKYQEHKNKLKSNKNDREYNDYLSDLLQKIGGAKQI